MEFFTSPIGAAFWGWLAFNLLMLSMFKDENEGSFKIVAYFKEHWDNWLASLVFIPVLLFVGMKGLQFQIDSQHLEWNDLYYPCSGFFVEAIKMAYKKWFNKNKPQ